MPKGAPATELELALARALFRTDKWDSARDKDAPFAWEDHRRKYIADARRLMLMFEKDGLELVKAPEAVDRSEAA